MRVCESENRPGTEEQERGDQLDHVICRRLEGVPLHWQLVKVVRNWIRQRLGLVKVLHAAEVPPAGVPSDLDQARPHHDAEEEPPHAPNDDGRAGELWELADPEQSSRY